MFKKNFSSADTKIGKNKSLFSLILVLVFLFVGIMLGHFLNLFLPKINNVPITKYQTEKKEVKNTLFENSFNWQLPSSDLIAFTYIKKGSEGIKDELISFSPDTKSSVNTKFLLKVAVGVLKIMEVPIR